MDVVNLSCAYWFLHFHHRRNCPPQTEIRAPLVREMNGKGLKYM